MKPLTKEEISFIRNDNYDWDPPDISTDDSDKDARKRYLRVQQSLFRKGLLKMKRPGFHAFGGYYPAEYEYTELGKQIAGFILRIKKLEHHLRGIKKNILDFVEV